jgi:hypothetical protein
MLAPETLHAAMLSGHLRGSLKDAGINEVLVSMKAHTARVNTGDMTSVESLLMSQALSLNSLFVGLHDKSNANSAAGYLQASEAYMRLALKAQAQSRATLETLSAIKNPPVVYAKQANFAGGHQQVLNQAGAFAQAENVSPTTELLEQTDGERMDTGAASQAGSTGPWLATVGAIHRPANGGGQGAVEDEPLPGRQEDEGTRTLPAGARVADERRQVPRGRRGSR